MKEIFVLPTHKKEKKMEKANAQKQQYVSPSLQSSLRCHTLAFFADAHVQQS